MVPTQTACQPTRLLSDDKTKTTIARVAHALLKNKGHASGLFLYLYNVVQLLAWFGGKQPVCQK
jgi:hypothetical protein